MDAQGILLLGLGIIILVVVIWLVDKFTRKSPRGTMLIIGLFLYLGTFWVENFFKLQSRFDRFAFGCLGTAGICIAIVGLIRCFWTPSKEKKEDAEIIEIKQQKENSSKKRKTVDRQLKFKEVVAVWWRFLWRVAAIEITLMICGGYGISYVGKMGIIAPRYLLYTALIYNLILVMLIPLLVFKWILGKKFGKSTLVVVPAAVKRKNPDDPKVRFFRLLLTWWGYFWRFAILAFCLGFIIGYCLPIISNYFFGNPLGLMKHTRYMALLFIPLSLLVFIHLMWQKEKRRKLDIIYLEPSRRIKA